MERSGFFARGMHAAEAPKRQKKEPQIRGRQDSALQIEKPQA